LVTKTQACLFALHSDSTLRYTAMARKKAHKQPVARPISSFSLDELLARAKDGSTQRVREYLAAGGSATRQVEATIDDKTLMVPLLHAICLCTHQFHKDLAGSIELLVRAGAHIDSTCVNSFGNSRTALMWACETTQCCSHPVSALLAAGADISLASVTDGRTAISVATIRGNLNAARTLLQHDADPYVVDVHTRDAVFYAANAGSTELLEVLLAHNGSAKAGSTPPLLAAASEGFVECAELLLANGAQVNSADAAGWTALHAAANSGSERIFRLLLAAGADVHACSNSGVTALHALANTSGSVPCARLLVAAGADATHTSPAGSDGALHAAVVAGHTELAQLLLQHGTAAQLNVLCPVNCECCRDATPFMTSRHPAVMKLLLAAGADVHVRSSTGNTCLHVAALHHLSMPVVCLLIKGGADITAENDKGLTAAQIARTEGNELLATVLDRAAEQQA
jgi:ankyrin repeat protein